MMFRPVRGVEHLACFRTVRTGIIEPDFLTLELPLSVRSGKFLFFYLRPKLSGSVSAGRSPSYLREGISDLLARGSIIRVLTVLHCTVILPVGVLGFSSLVIGTSDYIVALLYWPHVVWYGGFLYVSDGGFNEFLQHMGSKAKS